MTDKRLSAGRGNFASVWTDNADIGRRAAKHFLECGEYKSAGYIHGPRREFYSEERMRAFRKAMRRGGYGTEVLPDGNGDSDYLDRIQKLLKRLFKPTAVMAVADMRQLGRQSVKELDFLFRHPGRKRRLQDAPSPSISITALPVRPELLGGAGISVLCTC